MPENYFCRTCKKYIKDLGFCDIVDDIQTLCIFIGGIKQVMWYYYRQFFTVYSVFSEDIMSNDILADFVHLAQFLP